MANANAPGNDEDETAVIEAEVEIPSGYVPGDSFWIEVNGRAVEVVVPEGCVAGSVLTIEVPSVSELAFSESERVGLESSEPSQTLQPATELVEVEVAVPVQSKVGDTFSIEVHGNLYSVQVPEDAGPGSLFKVAVASQNTGPAKEEQGDVDIFVPDGVKAGDLLNVELSGQQLQVVVPHHCGPGSLLRLRAPHVSRHTSSVSSSALSKVEVTIPNGCKPGDSFFVNINGQDVLATVPPDAAPGDTVMLQLPASKTVPSAEEPATDALREAPSPESSSAAGAVSKEIEVAIPDDCKAGDTFIVVVDGKELQIAVPEGCGPGSVITFNIDADASPAKSAAAEVVVPEGLRPGDAFEVEYDGKMIEVDVPADCGPGSTIAIGIPVTPKESTREEAEASKPAQVSAPPAETVATKPEVSNEPETAPTAAQAVAPPASTVAPTNEEPAAVPAEAPREEEPATMELEVIIPDGVKPGDVFEVEFDGKMVEVDVPEGCGPGSAITILLPVTPKGSKGEEAPVATVPAQEPPATTVQMPPVATEPIRPAQGAVPDEPSNETAALIEVTGAAETNMVAEQVPEPQPEVVPNKAETPAAGRSPQEVPAPAAPPSEAAHKDAMAALVEHSKEVSETTSQEAAAALAQHSKEVSTIHTQEAAVALAEHSEEVSAITSQEASAALAQHSKEVSANNSQEAVAALAQHSKEVSAVHSQEAAVALAAHSKEVAEATKADAVPQDSAGAVVEPTAAPTAAPTATAAAPSAEPAAKETRSVDLADPVAQVVAAAVADVVEEQVSEPAPELLSPMNSMAQPSIGTLGKKEATEEIVEPVSPTQDNLLPQMPSTSVASGDIEVVIPDDVVPGDTFLVVLDDGRELEVGVPEGCGPGSVILIGTGEQDASPAVLADEEPPVASLGAPPPTSTQPPTPAEPAAAEPAQAPTKQESESIEIGVTVPVGSKAGDTFNAEWNGRPFEVVVPIGSGAGSLITVQVPLEPDVEEWVVTASTSSMGQDSLESPKASKQLVVQEPIPEAPRETSEPVAQPAEPQPAEAAKPAESTANAAEEQVVEPSPVQEAPEPVAEPAPPSPEEQASFGSPMPRMNELIQKQLQLPVEETVSPGSPLKRPATNRSVASNRSFGGPPTETVPSNTVKRRDWADEEMAAAKWLLEAQAVLICCGSGSEAAPFYEGGQLYSNEEHFKAHYPGMQQKGFKTAADCIDLVDSRLSSPEKWAFWAEHMQKTRKLPLDEATVERLGVAVGEKDYFVYTCNADSYFERAGFDRRRIYTPAGSWRYYQCARPCSNEAVFEATESWLAENGNGTSAPRCPLCGGECIPNVRLSEAFNHGQYTRGLQDLIQWIQRCAESQLKLVVLEMDSSFKTNRLASFPMESITADIPGSSLIRFSPEKYPFVPAVLQRAVGLPTDTFTELPDLLDKMLSADGRQRAAAAEKRLEQGASTRRTQRLVKSKSAEPIHWRRILEHLGEGLFNCAYERSM